MCDNYNWFRWWHDLKLFKGSKFVQNRSKKSLNEKKELKFGQNSLLAFIIWSFEKNLRWFGNQFKDFSSTKRSFLKKRKKRTSQKNFLIHLSMFEFVQTLNCCQRTVKLTNYKNKFLLYNNQLKCSNLFLACV